MPSIILIHSLKMKLKARTRHCIKIITISS
jgi:hypothetical protein